MKVIKYTLYLVEDNSKQHLTKVDLGQGGYRGCAPFPRNALRLSNRTMILQHLSTGVQHLSVMSPHPQENARSAPARGYQTHLTLTVPLSTLIYK